MSAPTGAAPTSTAPPSVAPPSPAPPSAAPPGAAPTSVAPASVAPTSVAPTRAAPPRAASPSPAAPKTVAPLRKGRRTSGLDALAELEKIRELAFRPKSKPETAPAPAAAAARPPAPRAAERNGAGEISRELELGLARADRGRIRRLTFLVHAEDETEGAPLSEARFHVDLEDTDALEKILLHLNIALSTR